MLPEWSNVATGVAFKFVARYCNWLQAGRPTSNVARDVFERLGCERRVGKAFHQHRHISRELHLGFLARDANR
jgi:hypothetical protein